MNAASGPCWRVKKSWITGSKMRTSNTSPSFLRRPSLEKIRPLSACELENFRPTTNPTPGNKTGCASAAGILPFDNAARTDPEDPRHYAAAGSERADREMLDRTQRG